MVDECGLVQLPMEDIPSGERERSRGINAWIEERMDKVLTSEGWCRRVEGARVLNISMRTSDHSIRFLGINDPWNRTSRPRCRFHFEMAWLLDEGCHGVVEKT